MAGPTLTTAATLMCPHGGTVQIVAVNTGTQAGGTPVATVADTFVVGGCPFQIPAAVPIPSPCVQVRWLVPDSRVKAGGSFTLSQSSSGLCVSAAGIPQGPVTIVNTQPRVKSQ